MLRQLKFLMFFLVVGLLSISGVTLASAPIGLPRAKLDAVTVCYFVDIGYQNISTSRQSVDAYVINYATGERTSATFTFSLDGGQSGNFRPVFLIPNPRQISQVLNGTWYSNSNMKIISYNEGFLPLEDCNGNLFSDGRLNDGEDQKAAPVVAFCEADGIGIYDIDEQSRGNLVFRVAYEDVTAGLEKAVADGAAQVLGQGGGDTLYALPSNELQLSGPELFTGKQYDYIFAGDICGSRDS